MCRAVQLGCGLPDLQLEPGLHMHTLFRRLAAGDPVQQQVERLRVLTANIRCCNSGSFTPDGRIDRDTAEMLHILERMATQEDADGI